MTTDPAVLAYAREVADAWGPLSQEEIEVVLSSFAPRFRALREREAPQRAA